MNTSRKRWTQRLAALRPAVVLLAAAAALVLTAGRSDAVEIQRVTSPGGIEAWLVQSEQVPLVAMRFAFEGGSTQDHDGKAGTAYFVSSMMDEGAGDMDSSAFQEAQEDLAMKMDFDATRDTMFGSFQTLTKNLDRTSELLRVALTSPRFDADATARIKGQILAALAIDRNDPNKVAAREWFKLAFGNHPYAHPVKGTADTVAGMTPDDLHDYVNRVFARSNLKVAVVGDISADDLGKLLDKVFGSLPSGANLTPVPEAEPPMGPQRKTIEMDIPQSVAQFGQSAIKRSDPDFIPAYILNYIVGGGGFSSELMEQVREKRGLAYSVYSYLYPYDHAAIYLGGVATKNAMVNKSLDVISETLKRIAEEGPTDKELADAKQYLTGSYALRFDTSTKIANQLLRIQLDHLGIDYVDTRNDMVDAVTMDDIKRVAKRFLDPDRLIYLIVGNPKPESG